MSFKRFDQEDLVISTEAITTPAWSGGNPVLTTFVTSSTQVASETGEFYYDIYDGDPTSSPSASVQFAIAYGDEEGSGSLDFNAAVPGVGASRTIYGQYRTMVLGDENSQFVFGDVTGSYFHVLSIERARFKEKIFPGFNLTLTGPGGTVQLTDNSGVTPSLIFNDAGRVFQVVSGSSSYPVNGNGFTPLSASYGLFLPDVGTIILNTEALSGSAADGGIDLVVSRSSNVSCENPLFMYEAIDAGSDFEMRSQETLSSDIVFVRARNNEFNYSENPSYISGSTGELIFPLFVESPQTYITSVGLYNDANELLAVAKLSKPLQKDFTKELLVRVKLDF